MSSPIFFSVIIPTYNRAEIIMDSINSVLNQKYGNFEIIVVDDGSTDETSLVIKAINSNRISYYKIPNSERGAARNFGIDKSNGEYVTFLDSDDIYYPDYLSNAFESLAKYRFPVFFHQAYEFKAAESNKVIRKFTVANDDIKSLVKGNHLSCIGIFIKKEVTDKFRFNEDRNLSGSEDWELWLRLAANFGLKTDGRISGALIVHKMRSVYNYPEEKLLMRKNLALMYAFEDEMVRKKFGEYRVAMEAYCDSYISLHLALSGQIKKTLRYLLRAIYLFPISVFNKRTIAIFKYILINIFNPVKVK